MLFGLGALYMLFGLWITDFQLKIQWLRKEL